VHKIKYIPEKYIRKKSTDFVIWHDENMGKGEIKILENAVLSAFKYISLLKLIKHKRILNFCIYSNLTEGCKILQRDILANMLMAPYTDEINSLIILFPPSISCVTPENLTRHLIHEIAHCFIDEKTGSKKELEDNDKDMRIESWKSEGLAEVISYYALGREKELEQKKFSDLSDKLLNENLNDLNSKVRGKAFEIATAKVFLEIQKFGLNKYFDSMSKNC